MGLFAPTPLKGPLGEAPEAKDLKGRKTACTTKTIGCLYVAGERAIVPDSAQASDGVVNCEVCVCIYICQTKTPN